MQRWNRVLIALTFGAVRAASPVVSLAVSSASTTPNPDAACTKCHRQIFESYERTPMAQASGKAVDGLIPGDFTHPASGVRYRVFLDGGKAWLSYQRASDSPVRALDGKQELRFYLGSGRRGRTYLFEQQGYWFEIPVNWYAKKQVWDMAPNFLQATEMPLTLPVDPGCLRCHASDFQRSLPDSRNHYASVPFTHGGIGCAACHGDASAHLTQSGKGPILNPAKLEPIRRDSVCLTCHLEGESSIARLGHTLTSYRPGDNLFDNIAFFVHKGQSGPAGRATSQWEALLESKCKQKSGDRLTCTTCHDPHSTPSSEERVSYYRNKCLTCHNDTAFVAQHHPENHDCASCHMPRQSTEDIAHEQVTDHRIQRVAAAEAGNVAARSDELTAIGNQSATPREYGLAYAQMALHGDKFARAQALKFLREAESSVDGKTPDPELHTQLGFLEQVRGNRAQAEQEYQAALRDNSLDSTAAGNLAVLRLQVGDTTDAVRLWQSAFNHDPTQLAAGYDLALTQCSLGKSAEALQTLKRLLLFSPDNTRARQLSVGIAGGSAACGGARLLPNHPSVDNNPRN